jgi:malate-CoA ligase subunit beta
MDIHEYQAKEILARFGVPCPRGGLAYSPEQAAYRTHELGGDRWVVKAQIHSGGRGEAGGVKVCSKRYGSAASLRPACLADRLITRQTGDEGKMVGRVYVEEAADIEQELYLGLVLDRASERIMVVASAQGGMEIEELSEKHPDAILRMTIDPATGFLEYQARELAFGLGLQSGQVAQAAKIFRACYRAFRDLDATMVEINPLIVTAKGELMALDAKMSFDDNALFRHQDISELRDMSQENPVEARAADRGLAYISLEGNIGCMINGAGLAMATMDMIRLKGGAPANFLDIGGGASPSAC